MTGAGRNRPRDAGRTPHLFPPTFQNSQQSWASRPDKTNTLAQPTDGSIHPITPAQPGGAPTALLVGRFQTAEPSSRPRRLNKARYKIWVRPLLYPPTASLHACTPARLATVLSPGDPNQPEESAYPRSKRVENSNPRSAGRRTTTGADSAAALRKISRRVSPPRGKRRGPLTLWILQLLQGETTRHVPSASMLRVWSLLYASEGGDGGNWGRDSVEEMACTHPLTEPPVSASAGRWACSRSRG